MFIAFDGMDGTGKSTQVDLLTAKLCNEGKKVQRLDFGRTPYFYEIIQKINTKEIHIPAEIREMIYYFEGLYANLNYIQAANSDEIIIIDRYYLSYFAYGLENGMSDKQIAFYTKNLIEPDIYFFLDADAQTTYERIQKYRKFDSPELGYHFDSEYSSEENIKKRFLSFQEKIRNNYFSHLKSKHIVIDATQPLEIVSRRIWDVIKAMD